MSDQYKGDITPNEAWKLLSENNQAVVVDVRTLAEWKCVGVPDLEGLTNGNYCIEWVRFPDGQPNACFLQELQAAVPNKDTPIYFLCRTGVRSVAAAIAATDLGYGNSYNILEGFEGTVDEEGHRGRTSGWQGRKLSWKH